MGDTGEVVRGVGGTGEGLRRGEEIGVEVACSGWVDSEEEGRKDDGGKD